MAVAINKKDFQRQPKKENKDLEKMKDNLARTRNSGRDLDSLFGIDFPDNIDYIVLEDLVAYSNIAAGHDRQPFLVRDDEEMAALIEDIKENGIFNPIIVNKIDDGKFMILSGHRRVHAARALGMRDVPCIVQEYDDVKAASVVVGSNLLNREKILPSERAAAYKLKMDVLRQQGRRTDLTSSQIETKLESTRTDEIIAQEEGVSRAQVQRYVRLNTLIPELLEKVDNDEIPVNAGVIISSLTETAQKRVLDVLAETGKTLTLDNSQKIKGLKNYTKQEIRDVLNPPKIKKEKAPKKVVEVKTDQKEEEKPEERIIPIPFSIIAERFSQDATDEEIIDRIVEALTLRWTKL